MSTMELQKVPLENRTPEDWLKILGQRLDAQAQLVGVYEDYYAGRHPLAFATSKYREAFGALFSAFADNWCEIVVDAAAERLSVVGFRFGENADEDAWAIWQANKLDSKSVAAHTEAGKNGTAYLLVDPNEGGDLPRISVEHPAQCIVARDPETGLRLAALKRWEGEDGLLYATVYLPDALFKFQADVLIAGAETNWQVRAGDPGGPNPLAVVPMVPLENKPGLLTGGISDLRTAIPLQNAINKECSDMIVASEYGAYRQRVITGVEIPRDPDTGRVIGKVQIEAAMSRLWNFEEPTAQVHDLPQTDLANYVKAIDLLIQHLAAQTRTPPHYLLGQVVNVSGDALKAAEAGLVKKCREKILFFSDAWEEAMALALNASGRSDVTAAQCEVLWQDPEQIPVTQLADAAVKKATVGVPQPVLWRELGYTPEQIAEMTVLAAAEAKAKQEQQQQMFDQQQQRLEQQQQSRQQGQQGQPFKQGQPSGSAP